MQKKQYLCAVFGMRLCVCRYDAHTLKLMSRDIAFILYNTPEYSEKVQVVVKEETLWMTQKAMGELFGCSSDNIGLHLKNIFEGGELDKNSVTEKISATAADGKNYLTQFYNLDAIIC